MSQIKNKCCLSLIICLSMSVSSNPQLPPPGIGGQPPPHDFRFSGSGAPPFGPPQGFGNFPGGPGPTFGNSGLPPPGPPFPNHGRFLGELQRPDGQGQKSDQFSGLPPIPPPPPDFGKSNEFKGMGPPPFANEPGLGPTGFDPFSFGFGGELPDGYEYFGDDLPTFDLESEEGKGTKDVDTTLDKLLTKIPVMGGLLSAITNILKGLVQLLDLTPLLGGADFLTSLASSSGLGGLAQIANLTKLTKLLG